jgi:thiosulfate reductase cytochrome b subunit
MAKRTRPQPLLIRLTHWVNIPVLLLLAMSGLQIWSAYPHFGPQGATYDWIPLQGWKAPEWLRVGRWLAGARNWHFALMWYLLANAAIYVGYQLASGQWRRRFFWPPRDTRPAIHQLAYYLRLRKDAPPVDLYNGLQRAAYTTAMILGALLVASGLVIYKPVQLHWLGWFLGGYDGARVVHFYAMVAMGAFLLGHLVMVAIHWRSFLEMITGGKPHD